MPWSREHPPCPKRDWHFGGDMLPNETWKQGIEEDSNDAQKTE